MSMVTNIIDTNSINIINNMGYEDIMKDITPNIVGKITKISNHIMFYIVQTLFNQSNFIFIFYLKKLSQKKFEIHIQDILDYK